MDVDGAWNRAHGGGEVLADGVGRARVVAAEDGDVDRRRGPEVQNLPHDVGRLEEELDPGLPVSEGPTQLVHVLARRHPPLGPQLDQDLGVLGADGPRVAVAQVQPAVWQPDVVDNRHDVIADRLADEAIDFVGQARRFFDAEAGSGAHVEPDLPGVDLREEIAAEDGHETHRRHAKQQKRT